MTDLTNVHDIDEAVTQQVGEGSTYHTIDDGLQFRASYDSDKDVILVFLPGRSTQRRTVRHNERVGVWRRWLENGSFAPEDYQDLGKNTAYLLAVLKQLAQ